MKSIISQKELQAATSCLNFAWIYSFVFVKDLWSEPDAGHGAWLTKTLYWCRRGKTQNTPTGGIPRTNSKNQTLPRERLHGNVDGFSGGEATHPACMDRRSAETRVTRANDAAPGFPREPPFKGFLTAGSGTGARWLKHGSGVQKWRPGEAVPLEGEEGGEAPPQYNRARLAETWLTPGHLGQSASLILGFIPRQIVCARGRFSSINFGLISRPGTCSFLSCSVRLSPLNWPCFSVFAPSWPALCQTFGCCVSLLHLSSTVDYLPVDFTLDYLPSKKLYFCIYHAGLLWSRSTCKTGSCFWYTQTTSSTCWKIHI